MDRNAELYNDIDTILLGRDEIDAKIKELGARIKEDYKGKDLILIGILKGAMIFFSDLIREIDLPLDVEFMAISSYGRSTKSSGVVQILKDLGCDITGRHVLVVEDIVDSGMTLSYLKGVLATRHAASVEICSLLDKPERRRVQLDVKYSCFNIPDAFVVGYGLDFAEKYRNLPDIGVLKREIYENA